MSEPHFERVAILGVGLIGGSLGLALRQRHLAGEVVGYSRTPATRRKALDLGALDRAAETPEACVAGAELVYLATPVATIVPLLAQVAPQLRAGAIVTDAGSSKVEIIAGAAALDLGGATFVGGHPMTGSEQMGVEAARADLFAGMAYVLCPAATGPLTALRRLERLCLALGARVYSLPADIHDQTVAAISHLPHLLATALMMVAQQRSEAGQPVWDLAAGSFASGTRVAASGPALWREILASNRAAALAALADCDAALNRLRELLTEARDDELEELLAQARSLKLAHGGRGDG